LLVSRRRGEINQIERSQMSKELGIPLCCPILI
jgi:hypothetical protein